MAKTATTGFTARKNLLGGANTIPNETFRIANSTTLKIGDAVRVNTGGFLVRAGAGAPVLGILLGIVNHLGINPFALGVDAAGATLTPDDQVATKAANQTDATYLSGEVSLDPAGQILYYNDASGDFAQTNLLQMVDVVAASGQIDQATLSDTAGQFQLVKLDPDGDGDASKGLFRLVESQLVSEVNNADTIISA